MQIDDAPKFDSAKRVLIPVTRQDRSEWEIPRIDAHARSLEQKREEARLDALKEGTTPQGREILRKLLFRAKRMLEEDGCSDRQIVAAVEGGLNEFQVLRAEFLVLLSRLWRVDHSGLCQLPSRAVALLILHGLKFERDQRVRQLQAGS